MTYDVERYRNLHCDFLTFDIVRSFADSCRGDILHSRIQADYIKVNEGGRVSPCHSQTVPKLTCFVIVPKVQTAQGVFAVSQRTKSDGRLI